MVGAGGLGRHRVPPFGSGGEERRRPGRVPRARGAWEELLGPAELAQRGRLVRLAGDAADHQQPGAFGRPSGPCARADELAEGSATGDGMASRPMQGMGLRQGHGADATEQLTQFWSARLPMRRAVER